MIPQPFVPRPPQIVAAGHITAHTRCAVWVDVGGGKTGAGLMAIDELALVEDLLPVLIIAPKRVARDTWPNEIKKWHEFSHITISPLIGTQKEREVAVKCKAMFHSINFENIEWLIDYWGDAWPYKTIIFDESSRLRGYRMRQGTKRSQALSKIAHKYVKRFIEFSATPQPNSLTGLWGQVHFLDQGQRLGRSYTAFEQRWFKKGWDGFSVEPLPHSQAEIQSKISDICISIDMKDYVDIKKPIVNNIEVILPSDAMVKYKEMEKQFFIELEGHPIEAFNAASKSGKLLQICNGAVYVSSETKEWKEVHTAKLEVLESIMEESSGMPILVGYNFISDRERILKYFKDKVVDIAKDSGWKAFISGKKSLGIAHPASMGHGVDGLQDVTNIITHFGLNWDSELYDQLNGRIGPMRQFQSGYDRPVFIHHILAKGTIDELVLERLTTKRKIQDILLTALKTRKLL